MVKLVWRMGEKATGRYKSFVKRAWPQATYGSVDGQIAFAMYSTSGEGYHPIFAETMELKIHVAKYEASGNWNWRVLVTRPVGVTNAKKLAAKFIADHPYYMPEEYR